MRLAQHLHMMSVRTHRAHLLENAVLLSAKTRGGLGMQNAQRFHQYITSTLSGPTHCFALASMSSSIRTRQVSPSCSEQEKPDRKSTRLNSKSLMRNSYAVFCLKKKKPKE